MLRYQNAIFPIFGGFWSGLRTGVAQGVVKHVIDFGLAKPFKGLTYK